MQNIFCFALHIRSVSVQRMLTIKCCIVDIYEKSCFFLFYFLFIWIHTKRIRLCGYLLYTCVYVSLSALSWNQISSWLLQFSIENTLHEVICFCSHRKQTISRRQNLFHSYVAYTRVFNIYSVDVVLVLRLGSLMDENIYFCILEKKKTGKFFFSLAQYKIDVFLLLCMSVVFSCF